MAAQSATAGLSPDLRPLVTKPFYLPPRDQTIREQIAKNAGVDPVRVGASAYVNRALAGHLVDARKNGALMPRTDYSESYLRTNPTPLEMSGMAGTNRIHRPYGIGRDPIGAEFNPMPSGPANPDYVPMANFLPFSGGGAGPGARVPRPVVANRARPFVPPSAPEAFVETGANVKETASASEDPMAGLDIENMTEEQVDALPDIFLETEAQIEAAPVSGPIDVVKAEAASGVLMVKQLPAHIREVLDARDKRSLSLPLTRTVPKENQPMMVRKLGMSLIEQKQEAVATAAATAASAQAAAAEAEAAQRAALEAELRAKVEHEVREKIAAEQKAKEQEQAAAAARAAAEAEQEAISELEREAISNVKAEANAFLEADAEAERRHNEELDALADAVASETVKDQEKLVSKTMTQLKQKIQVAAEEAAREATLPWWLRKSGKEMNKARAAEAEQRAKKLSATQPVVAAAAGASSPRFLETKAKAKAKAAVWNPPAHLMDNPALTAPSLNIIDANSPMAQRGYGPVGSFMESSATATSASTMAAAGAPSYHAYPPHSGQAVIRVARQANPYAFTTMDLLYPKLRRVWGLSGFPANGDTAAAVNQAAQPNPNVANPGAVGVSYTGNPAAVGLGGAPAAAPTAAAVPQAAYGGANGGANTIVINVGAGRGFPAQAATTTTTTAHANAGADIYNPLATPVVAGPGGPYSHHFPGAHTPPPSHMIHAGNPTPGTQLSDNGSFGSLKV